MYISQEQSSYSFCNLHPKFQSLDTIVLSYHLIYHKLENIHVEIIHVVNIHVDLFSWVYGTHENILT